MSKELIYNILGSGVMRRLKRACLWMTLALIVYMYVYSSNTHEEEHTRTRVKRVSKYNTDTGYNYIMSNAGAPRDETPKPTRNMINPLIGKFKRFKSVKALKDETNKLYKNITPPLWKFKRFKAAAIPRARSLVPKKFDWAHIESDYYRNRTRRITPLDHEFIVTSVPCSKSNPPFLVILCLSTYDHFDTRDVIRQTWANVSTSNARTLFILGRSELSKRHVDAFNKEDKTYGDIIVSDFVDSYHNLTRKVLMGLKWVNRYCTHVRYVLKVDEDTFVHVGNLISYLKAFKHRANGEIIGHVYPRPPVLREGKWGIEESVYPYPYFPPYVSGNSYVISGNVIERMVNVSEYLPYVFIEDVAITDGHLFHRVSIRRQIFTSGLPLVKILPSNVHVINVSEYLPYVFIEEVAITGILRTATNASLIFDGGFTFYARPPPKLCDFHHNATIKSATKTDDKLKMAIWKALHLSYSECKRIELKMHRHLQNKYRYML